MQSANVRRPDLDADSTGAAGIGGAREVTVPHRHGPVGHEADPNAVA
jgi:hypothetical protein